MRNNLRLRGFDCIMMLIAFLFTVTFGTLEAKVINPDGGFEAAAVTVGDDTSGVDGWSFQQASAGLANFVIVDDPVYEGNLALKITINSLGSNSWDIQAVNETFGVFAGVTYTVSVWARTETGTASANFTAGAPDYTEYGRLQVTDLSDTWTEYTFNFTVPSGKTEGRIPIHFSISGNEGKVIYLDALTVTGPGFVDMWGFISNGGWKIDTTQTGAGDAGMTGAESPTAWLGLYGEFDSLTATTENAVVATGQIEFSGGDLTNWSALRYGFYNNQNAGDLQYTGTDSATWSGNASAVNGYIFTPITATGGRISWRAGGNNTQGVIIDGGWNTTNNWGGVAPVPLGEVDPAPARASLTAGTYDFAISVQPQGDGTNELRWYLVKDDNSYWFGGTVTDTVPAPSTYNAVVFGIINGINTGMNNFQVKSVQVDLGAPITVPEAPWEPYYVTEWGSITAGTGWHFVPGVFDGDAGQAGDDVPSTWTGLAGQFEPVTATEEDAFILTGEIEFVGGGPEGWSSFRYCIGKNDSMGTLVDSANVMTGNHPDSTHWTGSAGNIYGYVVTPRSGTTDRISGNGGNGNIWRSDFGAWNSTWSSGRNITMGVFDNAPARAVMSAGTYEWKMSVQPLGDGTNEVRFYIQKKLAAGETQTSYFTGGIAIDTSGVASEFNFACFGVNNNVGTSMTGVNVTYVQVDKGAPITVPEPPWEPYYVTQWGSITAGTGWHFVPGVFDGDAGQAGDDVPSTWTGLAGQFEPVTATEEKAFILSGEIEFVGGGPEGWSSFRYCIGKNDSMGTLVDSANVMTGNHPDSTHWTGSAGNIYGYVVTPRSGTTDRISGNGGNGNIWRSDFGAWNSTWSSGRNITMGVFDNAPARAVMSAGTYEWKMSVQPLGDGTNEVRFYIQKKLAAGETQTSYFTGGIAIDTSGVASEFNFACFGVNNNVGTSMTGVNVTYVQVDKGTPIEVPEKPWQAYYIDTWGFSGGNLGGWDLTPGVFVGDVSIGGTEAPTGWSAVRGGFVEPYELTPVENRALIVTGTIELVGGGFEDVGSLRYGLFYSDSAGTTVQDSSLDSNWVWNGTDRAHSGYLIVPPSDNNIASWSGTAGTWGAVANATWWDIDASNNFPLGAPLQTPANAVAGSGTYDFAISVTPQSMGNLVQTYLRKTDGSYSFEASATYPVVATTNKFNCVAFAIDNSTTTAMNLTYVEVDRGALVDIKSGENNQLPTVYSLSQNYPNPFNPTTTIKFDLPQAGDVNLVVYDVVGRTVAELASGHYNAGRYKINFNAANLASGIYFYRLKVKDFVSVKKLILLK
jgi:hypothetical protein